MEYWQDSIFAKDCHQLDTYHTKYTNNPDDVVGQAITLPVCENKNEYGDGVSRKLLPSTEYTVVPYGERPRCTECDGTKVLIQRMSYKADPETCCRRNGVPNDPNLTCHPAYRNSMGEGCLPKMQTYCQKTANMLYDGACLNWCRAYPDKCISRQSELCNSLDKITNFKACKDFCIQNPGACDTGMTQYCKLTDNISKPECACINSYLDHYRYNPMCQDADCIRTGYGTASMKNSLGQGCEIIDCSVVFDLERTGNVSFQDTTIQQRCGNEEDNDVAVDDAFTSDRLMTVTPRTSNTSSPTLSKTMGVILIAVSVAVGVLLLGFMAWWVYKRYVTRAA